MQSNAELDEKKTLIGTHHISLGSPSPEVAFTDLEKSNSTNPAFQNFRTKLSKALTSHLGRRIRLDKEHSVSLYDFPFLHSDLVCLLEFKFYQITPYKYLKVNYESCISWRQETNILRINPEFHRRPRYDYVLIEVDSKDNDPAYIFAQLLEVFGVTVDEETYHMALILPMDGKVTRDPSRKKIDNTLGFTRLQSRHPSHSAFINVESIVRGGLLANSYEENVQADEHIVVDVIDEDMWWRMKSLRLVQNVSL